jgi:hypothetical protein
MLFPWSSSTSLAVSSILGAFNMLFNPAGRSKAHQLCRSQCRQESRMPFFKQCTAVQHSRLHKTCGPCPDVSSLLFNVTSHGFDDQLVHKTHTCRKAPSRTRNQSWDQSWNQKAEANQATLLQEQLSWSSRCPRRPSPWRPSRRNAPFCLPAQ